MSAGSADIASSKPDLSKWWQGLIKCFLQNVNNKKLVIFCSFTFFCFVKLTFAYQSRDELSG